MTKFIELVDSTCSINLVSNLYSFDILYKHYKVICFVVFVVFYDNQKQDMYEYQAYLFSNFR